MKGYSPAAPKIYHYVPGDLLLASLRLSAGGPVPLNAPAQPSGGDGEKVDNLFDIAKPKTDDFPALKRTLQFLKFSPDNVKDYYESIGMMINIVSGIVSVVGAVGSVVSLINSLVGPHEDQSLQYLQHISQRVDQIYGYLAGQVRRGLHDQAVDWRNHSEDVRNAVHNARTSRSPINLAELVRVKAPLDDNLTKMLDPESARIPFLRATYGYNQYSHWIDAATPPFMTLRDGTTINYRDPAQELQGDIWDPGHYIDMLLGCLADRMLLVATTEPAFRATNYDRPRLEQLVSDLGVFLIRWAYSIIVAHPLAGLNGGGQLQHPMYMPPDGIVIGAVDPVSGIACFDPYWDGFDIVTTWKGSISAKGKPDETKAKDFNTASAAALALQASLLDGIIHLSGLPRFEDFRLRLQELMTQYTTGSDFVHLPNAWFHRLTLAGPAAQPETVDLGFIGKYSQHPDARYQGHRYTQTGEKTFRFNMAVRTDVSLIQLGYRMELGGRSIELIPYSVAPGEGPPAPRFPTQPLSMDINAADWMIYDVYQNRVFSDADEDAFEGAVPPLGRRVATQTAWLTSTGTSRISRISSIGSVFPEERIFLNERKGPVALRVDITFDVDLNSPDQPYVGQATVTIRNLNPDACPGGIILPVHIYEIRPDASAAGHTQEVPADWMTIHIVPSFLVLPDQYFQDRREGRKSLDKIFGELNDRYAISATPVVPVGPEWQIRRQAVEEVAMDNAVQAFSRARPELADAVLQRYLGGIAHD